MRCEARTRSGRQCFNRALKNSDFCAAHRDRLSFGAIAATGLGMFIGSAVLPGLGGLALGGISGHVARSAMRKSSPQKKRVFVSFDFDNDRALKTFLIGQSKLPDSPFEIVDHSLIEAAPERMWERKARAAIRRSDLVLVIVGRNTYRARGVLKEVAMARACGIPRVQMIGYREGTYTPVPGAGRLYAWNWENLKRLLMG
jgi:hypothetical protein